MIMICRLELVFYHNFPAMFIFSEYEFSGVLYPLIGKVSTTYYGTAVKSKVVSNVPNVRVLEK